MAEVRASGATGGEAMSRHFEVKETMQTLAGIEWRERYSCYSARIAGWLDMSFAHSTDRNKPGLWVTVAGRNGKEPRNSPEEAAQYCVLIAKQLLAKASKELA